MFTREISPTLNLLRQTLIEMLGQCTDKQILIFKRMYSHKNLDAPIDEIVSGMPINKIEWAICQVENTLKKEAE